MAHDPRTVSFIERADRVYFDGRWHALPRGGDGPTDPEGDPTAAPAPDAAAAPGEEEQENAPAAPPQVPEDISGLEDDSLRDLHGQLGEARIAARERRDVPEVERLLADQNRIADELEARRQRRVADDARLAELDTVEPTALPEPVLASPAVTAGAGASAAELAAARGGAQPPAAQTPQPSQPSRPRVALLASAGNEVVQAGGELDWAQLGLAIDRTKNRAEGSTRLASIPAFEEMGDAGLPEPLSVNNGAPRNDELIRQAHADHYARLAAAARGDDPAMLAAICQPFDILRDIPDNFVVNMPVAGIFASRPAGRGGFQYTPSGVLSDVAGGVNLWNEANQAAVDVTNSATWKACIDYSCPPITTAVLEFIYSCVRFDLTLEMSNPERVRNLNNALAALEARVYEGRMLQRIDQLSSGYVFSGDYGALPAIIEGVNSLLAQLEFKDRQGEGNYTLILPPGATELLAIDRANRAYGTEEGASQDVMTYLRSNLEGVGAVVESLDASLAGEPGIPFPALAPVGNQGPNMGSIPFLSGNTFRMRLVEPSAAIYAETGEINAGVMRDSGLIRQNKTAFFRERGFFLAKHGPQPWATIDIHLCADGSRAGLVDPEGCLAS